MNFYSKLLNIKGENTEKLIEEAIKEVQTELANLDYERMCLVYNSYLYNTLLKKHVLVHIIDTSDLNLSYEHRFLLVFDGKEYYLCDLTYSQFKSSEFPELISKGYQKCSDEDIKRYLNIISKENINLCMDEVFTSNNKLRR